MSEFDPREFLNVAERELWDDSELCVATIENLLTALACERAKLWWLQQRIFAEGIPLNLRLPFGDVSYDPKEIAKR